MKSHVVIWPLVYLFFSSVFTKTEPQIKDCASAPVKHHTPLKATIHENLENLPPSPDLLSVPETPNSQIRPYESSPCRVADGRTPLSSKKSSSFCLSSGSKGSSVLRTKKPGGCSASIKRLFSPPEGSHNAKRPRTVLGTAVSTLNLTVSKNDESEIRSEKSRGGNTGTNVDSDLKPQVINAAMYNKYM